MSAWRITLLHVESDLQRKKQSKKLLRHRVCVCTALSARGGIKKSGLRRFKSLATRVYNSQAQVCGARCLISSLNRRVLRAIHQMNLLRVNYSATTTIKCRFSEFGVKTSRAYFMHVLRACFARFNLQYITARWTPRDRRRTRSQAAAEIACYTIKRARTEPSVPHLGALGLIPTASSSLAHTCTHAAIIS